MRLWFQILIDLLLMLRSPGSVIFGFYELGLSWLQSRRWWSLLFLLPVVSVAGVIGYNVISAIRQDSNELLANYWNWIDVQTTGGVVRSQPSLDEGDDGLPESDVSSEQVRQVDTALNKVLLNNQRISPFAETLVRKTLLLDRSNIRGIYIAALALANQAKSEHARQMMRSIAPNKVRGHPPAHAWLAADQIQRKGIQSREEVVILLHDLSIAMTWSGTSPLLMSVYSDLLIQEQRVTEALEVLKIAAQFDSTLTIKIAALAKEYQRPDLFDSIWQENDRVRVEKLEKGLGSESDFVIVASVMLLNGQAEQAIKLASMGVQQYREGSQIRRVLSNAYIVRFDEIRREPGKEQEIKLELLDLAMKADPANPSVLEKVGELAANELLSSERVTTTFRKLLASGKSTAISHLLLAIGHLREGKLEQALVHLELAHGLAPNNPIILNNLALALARTRPKELPRARVLIEQALKLGGADAERLDTYGEILAMGGDYLSAIRAYESALARRPDSQTTRSKLADAYERVNLPEMAETVRHSRP